MSAKCLGQIAGVFVLDAVLLLAVGAAMWHQATSAPQEAMGQGLFVLGVALSVPAFVLVIATLEKSPPTPPPPEPGRSDWDSA